MEYQIIRSSRKTMALQVTPKGVVVRAPNRMPRVQIERFVHEHRDWIVKQQHKLEVAQQRRAEITSLTAEELEQLRQQAAQIIPRRVAHYAGQLGVSCHRITIRAQKTRWGSCSSKGNLNFNCLLMLAPPEVLDAVVVHELCHLLHPNHSSAFYRQVLQVYPDYHIQNQWLKEHGGELLARLPKED